jgi:hypothetical protein
VNASMASKINQTNSGGWGIKSVLLLSEDVVLEFTCLCLFASS